MISEKEYFTMFGDNVLLKLKQTKDDNESKLIRQNAIDSESSHIGIVVSVSDAIEPKPNYQYGSEVLFDVYNSEKFEYGDVTYYIAHSKDVFAVLGGNN